MVVESVLLSTRYCWRLHSGAFSSLSPKYPALFCSLTRSRPPLRGVGCGEADANAMLIDFEPQAALFVILGKLAQFRIMRNVRNCLSFTILTSPLEKSFSK